MCIQTERSQPDRSEPDRTPIEELPPSAKLTYKTLEYEGPFTQKALVEQTRLPERTVRDALSQLIEHGYVEERLYLEDARQRLYVLTEQ